MGRRVKCFGLVKNSRVWPALSFSSKSSGNLFAFQNVQIETPGHMSSRAHVSRKRRSPSSGDHHRLAWKRSATERITRIHREAEFLPCQRQAVKGTCGDLEIRVDA